MKKLRNTSMLEYLQREPTRVQPSTSTLQMQPDAQEHPRAAVRGRQQSILNFMVRLDVRKPNDKPDDHAKDIEHQDVSEPRMGQSKSYAGKAEAQRPEQQGGQGRPFKF